MSAKRAATSNLNHENWDQDDDEPEEMGTFKPASKDILEKRVIRTAKRRSLATSGDEAKKSVFSGFSGFNKAQPSSFDFLSNLTNGNSQANGNGASANKNETISTGLFGSPPASGSTPMGSSLFNINTSLSNISKPSTLFGITPTSTIDSKPTAIFGITSQSPSISSKPASIFGIPPTSSTATPANFKMPTVSTSSTAFTLNNMASNTNKMEQKPSQFPQTPKVIETSSPPDKQKKSNESKAEYYAKLKGLNESVSDWIKKHVEKNSLCILTPIFRDYEKYLKEIEEEMDLACEDDTAETNENNTISKDKPPLEKETPKTSTSPGFNISKSSFSPKPSSVTASVFSTAAATSPSSGSLFSSKPSVAFSMSPSTQASSTFSFGVNTSPKANTVISQAAKSPTAPFSFGIGVPFSFGSNINQKPDDQSGNQDKKTEDDEDEPPKVEFTPVVEENSVYDKRCKVFVKKDGNFSDRGIGTLFIKKIEETGKHQLIVRANTSLGNVLLNLILSDAVPTQRMGKNNVMIVCIPTPDAKPPPIPVLLRVKTSEEADALLEIMTKYKT